MEKVGNLMGGLESYFNDLRQVLNESQQPARTYNKTSQNKYKPTEARFKLVVWFKDGNKRTFFSYDNVYFNKEKHVDENISLKKLLRLMEKYKADFKNAIIYVNMDPDRQINTNQFNIAFVWYKISGEKVINNAGRFVVNGKNNVLNLKHLEMYSPKELKNGNV